MAKRTRNPNDLSRLWSHDELAAMNSAFRTAMMSALASGLERCATAVSTSFGTRHPITDYRPPDCT